MIHPSPFADFNATMRKFGAPQTVIHNYQHWTVMLRPAQVTLGALVLAAHEPVTSFSQLSLDSFTELSKVIQHIEATLTQAFQYDRINYLMLMMVDPDVHFHVLPRYAGPRSFAGMEFVDAGWPGVPNLGTPNHTDSTINQHILQQLQSSWPE